MLLCLLLYLMHVLVVRNNSSFSLFYDYSTVKAICLSYYSLWPRRTYTRKVPSISNHTNSRSGMATASRIRLSLNTPGVFHVPDITEESAAKASEVLQENHENHHIFFNQSGFHSRYRSFRRISSGVLKSSIRCKSLIALYLRATRGF